MLGAINKFAAGSGAPAAATSEAEAIERRDALRIQVPNGQPSPQQVVAHAAAKARGVASPPVTALAILTPTSSVGPDPVTTEAGTPPSAPASLEDERDRVVIETLLDVCLNRSPLSEPVAAITLLSARLSRVMSSLILAPGGEVAGVEQRTLDGSIAASVETDHAVARLAIEPVAIAVEPLTARGLASVGFAEVVEALAGPALITHPPGSASPDDANRSIGLAVPAAPARDQRRRVLALTTLRDLGGVGIDLALRSLSAAWLASAGVEWVEEYLETLAMQSASVRIMLARDQDQQAMVAPGGSSVAGEGIARPPLTTAERDGLRIDAFDQEVARILLGFMVLQQRARQIGMSEEVATSLGIQQTLHEALVFLVDLAPARSSRDLDR